MIKLLDLLREMYIDQQGNLVGEADFVVLEGGFNGGIYKDIETINPNDYINFKTKLSSFRKKDIANKIYKQVLEIYNRTALKKYNENIGFNPELEYGGGDGNWNEASYNIYLSKGVSLDGILNSYYYLPTTGFDDFIKGMRKALDVKDNETDGEKLLNKEKDLSRFKDFSKGELEAKIKHTLVTCIPKYSFDGDVMDQINADVSTGNNNFGDNHNLYSKQDLYNDLNEIGLFLIGENNKGETYVDLNKEGYNLYSVEFLTEYTAWRDDGSSYDMELGKSSFSKEHLSKDIVTNYVLTKKNETVEQTLKKFKSNSFNIYDELFSNKIDGQEKNELKQIKKDIKEIPNAKISSKFFNYLKKNTYYGDSNVKLDSEYSNIQSYAQNTVINKDGIISPQKFLK